MNKQTKGLLWILGAAIGHVILPYFLGKLIITTNYYVTWLFGFSLFIFIMIVIKMIEKLLKVKIMIFEFYLGMSYYSFENIYNLIAPFINLKKDPSELTKGIIGVIFLSIVTILFFFLFSSEYKKLIELFN